MKLLLSILVVVATQSAQSEQTNTHTQSETGIFERIRVAGSPYSPLLIHDKDEKTPVWVMELLRSAAVRDLFPSVTAYRLISSRDIIHGARFSALVIDTNGSPSHLQTDAEAAFFVGGMSRQVTSKADALRLARAFADLRSYRIVESPPNFPDARGPEKQPAPADTDYKFFAEERKDEWRVYATFFTSEYGSTYERYVFSIPKPPGGGLLLADPVLIRLRNYIY